MSVYSGIVKNGVIVFLPGVTPPPDGTTGWIEYTPQEKNTENEEASAQDSELEGKGEGDK